MNKTFPSTLNSMDSIFKNPIDKYSFVIDCPNLPADGIFILADRYNSSLDYLFKSLDNIHHHCIYWYEAESVASAKLFFDALENYRPIAKSLNRFVPVVNENSGTAVLYVGKSEAGFRKKDNLSKISSRTFHHLGYYSQGTQGLNLINWAKPLNEKLTLQIRAFPSLEKRYLSLIEMFFALELKPLLGKH